MTSPKQLAANRRNAQKSTGPKTPDGKAVAKMNALKHGLLSADAVVRGLKLHESPRQFNALREQLWQDLSPVGPLEKWLVERILTTCWRLHRVPIAERGEIALSVDNGHWLRTRPDNRFMW